MDESTAAYLAGYLERGGAIRIYVNKAGEESPKIEISVGETLAIESAGIYIRVRAGDMTVLRLLREAFGGKLKPGQWQGWNEDAAGVLQAIIPYLKSGKRRAIANLALEFHAVMEEKRQQAKGSTLFFTVEDIEVVTRYEVALKEIAES